MVAAAWQQHSHLQSMQVRLHDVTQCCMLLPIRLLYGCGQSQGRHLQCKQARLHDVKQSSCTLIGTAVLWWAQHSCSCQLPVGRMRREGSNVHSRLLHRAHAYPTPCSMGRARLLCSDGAIPVVMPSSDLLRQAKQGQGSCTQRINSVKSVVMSLPLLQHCHLQRWQAMQEQGTCSQQAAVWCHLCSLQASTCLCDLIGLLGQVHWAASSCKPLAADGCRAVRWADLPVLSAKHNLGCSPSTTLFVTQAGL